MRQRGNISVLGLPTVIGMCFVYGYALTYLTIEPGQFGIYRPRHQWLYVHIVAGIIALLSGPTQFWLGLNRRTAVVHRILGISYVLAVGGGSVAAFYLARHTDFGWVFGLGFSAMAFVWIVTTLFATLAICLHRVEQHREWMIRSYVVTFGFVMFRIVDSVLETARLGTLVERMTAASWLAWTIPLFITESILQARKIFVKRAVTVTKPLDVNGYIAEPEPKAFDLQRSESSYQHQP
jgi:hypothetical protein